ncbi:hypothetical protein V6N11_054734 [Hibiscus sabdariffa]|uniref:Uncharacterized protein n=1 Tax=Hibiscus sabdariffa TaxID=183260 RepID=A0ABR2S5M0_9ROSI
MSRFRFVRMKMKADVARRKKKGSDWNDQRREYSSLDTYWRRVVDKRDQCVEIETNKLFDDDQYIANYGFGEGISSGKYQRVFSDESSGINSPLDVHKYGSGNRDVGCIDIRDSTIPGGDRLDASN